MIMQKKRLYIAGPMHGYDEFNYSAFYFAADTIRNTPELGDVWQVCNPAEISNDFAPTPDDLAKAPDLLKRLMEFELAVVKSCDAILLLRGWEKSEGARAELRVALDNNLEIYTQESGVLIR